MNAADGLAFVTGGSGFVGRHLIGVLRERGVTVRALGRSAAALAAVQQAGAEPVPGDLESAAALQAGMAGCKVVYHCAAKAEDWGDPAEFHRINVVGTEHVLAAARAAGVPRLVHVSTEAVLVGGPPIRNADESWPLPARPLGLYPLTKGLAEQRVIAANGGGLTTVVVRPRFIWGRGDTNLLVRLVAMAKKGEFAWIGGGLHLTSTCHVANVCEGMLLAASRGVGAQVYFLTDGPPVQQREFWTAMLRTQGVQLGTRSVPRWLAGAAAWAMEASCRTFGVPAQPLLTRTAVHLIGEEVTVNDARARRELGYVGHMTRAAGLLEMGLA